MRLVLPASTVERVTARVKVDAGATDPRGYLVDWALIDPDTQTPAPGDWQSAAWQVAGPPYVAEALVTGTVGTFRFWLRIHAGAELPVRAVGIIEFV